MARKSKKNKKKGQKADRSKFQKELNKPAS